MLTTFKLPGCDARDEIEERLSRNAVSNFFLVFWFLPFESRIGRPKKKGNCILYPSVRSSVGHSAQLSITYDTRSSLELKRDYNFHVRERFLVVPSVFWKYLLTSATAYCMETRTVKPPKALPNTFRKVMPALVIANKHSQGKKDLGDLKYITFHIAHSPSIDCSNIYEDFQNNCRYKPECSTGSYHSSFSSVSPVFSSVNSTSKISKSLSFSSQAIAYNWFSCAESKKIGD